jgi:hypothetical protein
MNSLAAVSFCRRIFVRSMESVNYLFECYGYQELVIYLVLNGTVGNCGCAVSNGVLVSE